MLRAELEATEPPLELELEVQAGECVALAGPSGAGKTSALRALAGLLHPEAGRVECDGKTWLDIARGVDLAPECRRCGLVFQDYALFPHLSAWRNVGYALPRAQRREKALELLARFGIEDRADARPHELSGGERQRVALARTLAAEPRALLLDEPLASLDATTRNHASRELARTLRELDIPTVLVTHDFAEAAVLGHRVAVLDAGRIVQEGTASELAARPASAFVADFTGAVVLTGEANPGAPTTVALDGGGTVATTDAASGRVAVSVHPWEIALLPANADRSGSARNWLEAEVVSVTEIGGRVRVGLQATQPLAAEVTAAAVRDMHLAPGTKVVASWKAAATRAAPL